MTEFYKKSNVNNLYMFPSIFTKKKNKKLSSGQNSPNFLEWSKMKRKKRHIKIRRRRALKKLLEKKRKKQILKAFENLYFHERLFDSDEWKIIEERFAYHKDSFPPHSIILWFLDR